MRKILVILISFYLLGGEIFFMPFEKRDALNKFLKSIDNAKAKIDIAIYSFTNKTIAKRLKNAAKRGVKIRIIFDEETNLKNPHSQIGYLSKYKNIETFILKGKPFKFNGFGKMHIKLAIIDNKKIILGSANYSFSAFSKNYETIYFIDKDFRIAKKSTKFFELMLKKAQKY